jgi:hypothetical protein
MFWYQQPKPPTWNFSHKKIVPTIAKIIKSQVIEAIMWTHMVCTNYGENIFQVLFKRSEMLRMDMRKFLWKIHKRTRGVKELMIPTMMKIKDSFQLELGCDHSQTSQKPCQTIEVLVLVKYFWTLTSQNQIYKALS